MELSNRLLDENVVAQFSSKQINTYFSLYLKNANTLIDSLKNDIANNDLESIRQRAHKLKGSSMVVGATSLRNLSSEIEEAAKDKQEVSKEKYDQLREQFDQLVNLLQNKYNLGFTREI